MIFPTKMVITRDIVIEALEDEPLLARGSWINYENCKVCAVGAIFRAVGVPDNHIRLTALNFIHYRDNALGHGISRNWISAISSVWERFAWECELDIEEARAHMLDWAEANLPDDINLATGQPI